MVSHDSPIPLYYQLYELLRAQIEAGDIKSGDKLETESEMMRRYGIGRLTVRSALAQLVNIGYIKKVHGKGTFCAYAPPAPERMNIDVLLDINDTYFSPYYMKSIAEVLNRAGCNMRVGDTKDSAREIIAQLGRIVESGSDGVILEPSHIKEDAPPELIARMQNLAAAGIPLIMIDSAYDIPDASFLRLDEIAGGRIAAEYLIGLGHSRAAVLYHRGYQDSLMRRDGFSRGYADAGLPQPSSCAVEEGGFEAVLAGLRGGLFTAVFCYNDEMAVELMHTLRERGLRVPEDVSVMGFDDSVLATAIEPNLSSIAHPKEKLGRETAQVLLDFIARRRTPPHQRLFEPALVARGSCAAV